MTVFDQNCASENIKALYGKGSITRINPSIYLQHQVPLFGSLRTSLSELSYRDPRGTVYNGAIKLGVPISFNLGQVNPKKDTYAKCVCGPDTTIQKITPPDNFIVEKLCTCTFYNDPPLVTFTTTYTTTKVGGVVATESGVIIGHDKKGSYFTTTSLFPHTGTVGTTVFTTTNSDGSVGTGSGALIVAKDSMGSFTTSTSLFPSTGTVGTTVFTTTNSDGSVETESGVVIVSKDSKGSFFTTTSLFLNIRISSASGSSVTLPEMSAHSSGSSSYLRFNPGGWNSSYVAPLTSNLLSSSNLTYRSTDGSPSCSSGSISSSDISGEPAVPHRLRSSCVTCLPTDGSSSFSGGSIGSSFVPGGPVVSIPTSSELYKGSVRPTGSSSSVVTRIRTVVTTKTNASGVTEVEATTFTTTYCPLSTSGHAEQIGPNGSKDQGGLARHTDSSDMLPFNDVLSKNSPGDVPNEQTIATALRMASVAGSGITMTDGRLVSSNRPAAESSAVVTLSPSLLSIALGKTNSPVTGAVSSLYSTSVPVYEGLARVISPMTMMIFIPILALGL